MSSKSLEEELGIPKEASLSHSPPWTLESKQGNGSISISPKTSLRQDEYDDSSPPRCLLVGRQASTADIRIQHGSISRKHALLYYGNDGRFYLCDLNGKHGTHVNGNRISGAVPLKNGDTIYFGTVQASSFIVKSPNESVTKEQESVVPTERQQESAPVETNTTKEPGEGLTGRAKREAEIAAMMASLDEKPSYQKYVAPTEPITIQQEQPTPQSTTSLANRYDLPVAERFDIDNDGSGGDRKRRIVTSMAIDPAGSRFAAGGTDTYLRLYDFGGMDQIRTGPFKTIEVEEGHLLVDVCYSNTGDRLLVATGSVQPKVLDRDGNEIIQFVRGDMYVTDQARTSGHTAGITGVDWHPLERDIVLTSSMDGSARLWNLNGRTQFQKLVCDKVYRAKNSKGQRVGVTAVAFHPGGREFALGTACGSIQIWNATRVGARPERAVFDSHGEGRPINSLSYNVDGSQICSRSSEDDDIKVWDTRRISRSCSPIVTCKGLATVHERSNAVFSPDGCFLCAGTSCYGKGPNGEHVESGSLKVFLVKGSASAKPKVGSLLFSSPVADAGVVMVYWHAKLNQIFIGCSDGRIGIFFDPTTSSKGAVLTSSKVGHGPDELTQLLASRASQGSAAIVGEIISPNVLPIFRDHAEKSTKRKREKERLDPIKSRKPEPPATGKFKQGSQSGAAVSFSQFVASSSIQNNKIIAGRDPREELLKYREGKSYTNKAYEGNQQNPLEQKTLEEEEEESKK